MWEARVSMLHFLTCPELLPDPWHCRFLWPKLFRLSHQQVSVVCLRHHPSVFRKALFSDLLEEIRSSLSALWDLRFLHSWLVGHMPDPVRTPENIIWGSADSLQKDCLSRGIVSLPSCDEYFQRGGHQCKNCQSMSLWFTKQWRSFCSSPLSSRMFYLLCGIGYKQAWALRAWRGEQLLWGSQTFSASKGQYGAKISSPIFVKRALLPTPS